jgi:hypothetical protein
MTNRDNDKFEASYLILFFRNILQTDTHTCISIYSYKHTYAHPTGMSTSERLNWVDLKIHKVGHQEHLTVDGNVTSY